MTVKLGPPSRRDLMLGLAAAGMTPPMTWGAPTEGAGLIDFHHHFFAPSPSFAGIVSETVAQTVEGLDRSGIATAIGWAGPVQTPGEPGRKQARGQNDYAATVVRGHPQRFGLFASMPHILDTDAVLAEIRFAFDELKADGVGLTTNYGDVWLGDPRVRPVLEELNRRKALVFVHPADAPCCTPDVLSYQSGMVTTPWLEFTFNTARTMLSLMVSGAVRDLADIRFIFCHGGGAMGPLVGRLDGLRAWQAIDPDKFDALFPQGVAAQFQSFYLECAQSLTEPNMAMLARLTDSSRLLFGTDYPHFKLEHSQHLFEELTLPSDVRRAIARGNGETLLPRLRPA